MSTLAAGFRGHDPRVGLIMDDSSRCFTCDSSKALLYIPVEAFI